MQKNSHNFSMQEALRLAQSDAGQQLLAHLRQKDSQTINAAMEQASQGNYDQAKQALSSLLSDPKVQELMKQLGG